jgi:hypothetical protein
MKVTFSRTNQLARVGMPRHRSATVQRNATHCPATRPNVVLHLTLSDTLGHTRTHSEFRFNSTALFNIIWHPTKDFIHRFAGKPCFWHTLFTACLSTVWNMKFVFQFVMWNSLLVQLTKRYSGHQQTMDEMGGLCSTRGEKLNTHWAVVNKVEVKSIMVRPRRRWEKNSKIDLMVWIGLMWLRTGINFRLHKRRGDFLASWETISFSRRSLPDGFGFKIVKVKNQLDTTKYAVLLPQHVSAIKLHTLSHLVGSLPSLRSRFL